MLTPGELSTFSGGEPPEVVKNRTEALCVDCGGPTEPGSELYAEALCNRCALARSTVERSAGRHSLAAPDHDMRLEREAIQAESDEIPDSESEP